MMKQRTTLVKLLITFLLLSPAFSDPRERRGDDKRYSRDDSRHTDRYEEKTNRRKAQIEKILEETATKLENHRSGTEVLDETVGFVLG